MNSHTACKRNFMTGITLILIAAFFIFAGCESQDGPAEKAGEKIDQTIEQIGDSVGNSMEEAGDAVKDATN